MRRIATILVPFLAITLLVGCPSDDPIEDPDDLGVDGTSTGDDGTSVTDSTDATDSTDTTDVTDPPSLACEIGLRDGRAAFGPPDTLALADKDEPEKYLPAEGAPDDGFQVDFFVSAKGISPDQPVRLLIDGAQQAEQDLDSQGETGFLQITLNEGESTVVLEADTSDGSVVRCNATKMTYTPDNVEPKPCDVVLVPTATPDECVITDDDESADGTQLEVTVRNPNGECKQAFVTWTIDGVESTASAVDLDEANEATFTIDVTDVAAANGVTVLVVGVVVPESEEIAIGDQAEETYFVDASAPVTAITAPIVTDLGAGDDASLDDGFQVTIAGTMDGASDQGNVVSVVGCGSEKSTSPDAAGDWNVQLTCADGLHTITAASTDGCGHASPEVSMKISVSSAASTLTITAPEADSTLLANLDEIAETDTAYDTTFAVTVSPVPPMPYTLSIECGMDADGAGLVEVGAMAFDEAPVDDVYLVPVVLDWAGAGSKQICVAKDTAVNPGTSSTIKITVALPAPQLQILKPDENSWTNSTAILVSGSSKNINGISGGTVQVLNTAGESQYTSGTVALPAPAQDDGFTWSLHLTENGTDGAPALPDGDYEFVVSVEDQYGNLACDSSVSDCKVWVKLDTTAPGATIYKPDKASLDAATDPDTSEAPGYQTDIGVEVEDGGNETDAEVCLTVNGATVGCETVKDGSETVLFSGVTIQPGNNTLSTVATDAAGNTTDPPVTKDLYLDSDAPVVTITSPGGDTSTAFPTIDLTVHVTDAAGTDTDGAVVSALVDGVPAAAASVTALGGGSYQLEDVQLGGFGIHKVTAQADVGGIFGFSAELSVNVKEDEPTIVLTTLPIGAVLNKASAECTPGKTDCELTITCATAAVDNLSAAKLDVDCGGEPASYANLIVNDAAEFPGVTLTNNASCTLTCSATDKGTGKVAFSTPITVAIDRTAPKINKFVAPAKGTLIFVDDESALLGFQYTVQVSVTGLEAGQTVNLDIQPAPADGVPAPVTLDAPVGDDASLNIPFAQTTLGQGVVTLTVTTTDAAGNSATNLVQIINVISEEPFVRISQPFYVAAEACTTHAECGAGLCVDGLCAVGWSGASNRSILVTVSNLPDLADNLRICSDNPAYADQPECASGAGFHQVAQTAVSGTIKDVDVSAVVDGIHVFVAEAKLTEGGLWMSSLESSEPADKDRRIFIDTAAPSVGTVGSPSDAGADGCLNIAEGDGTYDLSVTCDSDGAMQVFLGTVSLGEAEVTGGSAATLAGVALSEGENSITAQCTDDVGNLSSQATYEVTVDVTAPDLDFTKPVKTTLLSGDSLDVELLSDAHGQSVDLLCTKTGEVGTATVDDGGVAAFTNDPYGALTEGVQSCTATVSDSCGNASVASSATITVDTVPPGLTLVEPAEAVSLTDADDADPAGGFQVSVKVATSGDAATWSVTLQTACAADFTGCAPAIDVAGGAVTAPDGEEPAILATLPVSKSPDYMLLTATVKDAAGNTVTTTSQLTITLSDCSAVVAGLPAGGFVGNALCPTSGSDCDSVELSFQVLLVGACAAVTGVDLYEGGAKVATATVTDAAAAFTRTFTHGAPLVLEAKDAGDPSLSTGAKTYQTDLKDPVPAFVVKAFGSFSTPASGSNTMWNKASDRSPTAGLQVHLSLDVTDDGLGDGTVDSVTAGGAPLTVTPALPIDITGASFSVDILNVTVPEAADETLMATVSDAAGNTATTSFTFTADTVIPGALALTIDGFNRRRPTLDLSWTATADNGASGTAAAEYDIRYSLLPITAGNFESACQAANITGAAPLPTPGSPGAAETYSVSGPDYRGAGYTENGNDCYWVVRADGGTYHVAARVKDAAGNWSPLSASSVVDTQELALRSAKFAVTGTMAHKDFEGRCSAIGDINNDGFGDFAMGGGSHSGAPAGRTCIFYGSDQATVPDLSIDPATAPTGSNYQCILDAPIRFGYPAKNVGDVNGDGLQDIAIPGGRKSSGVAPEVRVYLGVNGGQISTVPALIITGYVENSVQGKFGGGGNFNGDISGTGNGIDDLIVGSRHEGSGRAYVIPGAETWPGAVLDLSVPADVTAFNVQTIHLSGDAPATTQFGAEVDFVGDILSDAGATYDDVVISAYASQGTSRAYVVKGRAISGPATLILSEAFDGSQAEDANAVRLLPDGGPNNFGSGFITNSDVDGDGVVDLFIHHTKNKGFNMLYLYSGASIAASLGDTLQLNAAAEPVGDNQHLSDDGVIFGGDGAGGDAYHGYAGLGNVNDDPTTGADPVAIGHRHSSSSAAGEGFIRFNVNDSANGLGFGTYPYADIQLYDPYDAGSSKYAWRDVIGLSDFNGDGQVDILVGTNGSGYAVLLY